MFGIGFFELVLIAVAVLIFVGPQKLPDVMRQAGKLFVQVRRTANDVRGTFDTIIRDAEDELRKEEQAALKELLSAKAAATKSLTAAPEQIIEGGDHLIHEAPAPGAHAMASPHAAPAPHPAAPENVTHSQPALQPVPAPHPAGPDSVAAAVPGSEPIDKV